MRCDIEIEPLPFFLRRVYLEKLSGHLFVTTKDFQISLNFLDGILVNGMSTRFDEKLTVILHLMGGINEEQYNFLSGLHQFSDDQVSRILLDHNFARKKDIYYARIYQLRRIAISTFSLKRGEWVFTPGEPEPPLKETFDIPLTGILVEGARTIDRISSFSGKWLLHIPVPFNEIPLSVEIYFTDAERDFFNQLLKQESRSCQELIAQLNIQPIDFWRKILSFYLLGIMNFQECRTVTDISREIAELLVLNQKIQNAAIDDFSLLGLLPDASSAAIENIRAELLTRFSPKRFGSAAAPEIKKIAQDVCRRIQMVMPRPDVALLLQTEVPLQAASLPSLEPEKPREKAWSLYLQGKELYEKRDFAQAIQAFKLAIKLEPTQGDFHYFLGLSQMESDMNVGEAESNLKKAIELKFWSADPVYALGILFRRQDKLKLAERCFQRVKEIAHEHTGASRALVDLRRLRLTKKDKISFLKKKIF